MQEGVGTLRKNGTQTHNIWFRNSLVIPEQIIIMLKQADVLAVLLGTDNAPVAQCTADKGDSPETWRQGHCEIGRSEDLKGLVQLAVDPGAAVSPETSQGKDPTDRHPGFNIIWGREIAFHMYAHAGHDPRLNADHQLRVFFSILGQSKIFSASLWAVRPPLFISLAIVMLGAPRARTRTGLMLGRLKVNTSLSCFRLNVRSRFSSAMSPFKK